jgi:NAD(P)-dependent dehydrogenase (short-subunit alcohol dehydrogenase family)
MELDISMGFAPPSDIASVICFLASDDARNMTGAAVPVDRGMTA